MATLYIFGDESGTMPIKDSDKPFVACTVAFLGKLPDTIQSFDADNKIADILKKTNGIPFAAVVNPFPGYHQNLMTKYNTIETMARAKCLLDGSNIQYPDRDGFNLSNEVWDSAMSQTIPHAVMHTVLGGCIIDDMRIIFDEKSMSKRRRNLFEQSIHKIGTYLKEYLETFEQKYPPNEVCVYKNCIRFSAESISVHWSNDANLLNCESGLKLVHRFAQKMYRQLVKEDQTGFEANLRNAGFKDVVLDITKLIIRPLNKNIIDDWKIDTGLPEPKA